MADEDIYRLKTMYALDPPEKAWKQFSALFDLTPLRMAQNSGHIENYTWIAGSNVYAQVSLDGNLHHHTDQHLSQSGDLLFVHRYLTGGADGQSGDVPYMMRPGAMIFHDYGRPFRGIQMPSTIQSVFIPHRLIGYDPKRMPPQIVFDQSTPEGTAMSEAFDALMADFTHSTAILEKARVREFSRLVSATLPEPDAAPTTQQLVQRYIDKYLSNPDLNETGVQTLFHLSKSQLFELLADFGGFSNYLTTRRVMHALFDLHQHPARRGQLDKMAMKWGFSSAETLKQAVRSVYQSDIETIFDA